MLAGTLIAVLFAAVATRGDVEYFDSAPSFSSDPPAARTVTNGPEPIVVADEWSEDEPIEIPGFITLILRLVLIGGLVALLALLAVHAWRNRPKLRWRRRSPPPDFDVLDEVAAAIADDAAEQRAALRRGAPRNAIVECWLRLEAAVYDAGVARNPADTSAELTARVLARFSIDQSALTDLAALYREARFSTHDMDESTRDRAIHALDAVHAGLGRQDRSVVGPVDATGAST